MSCFWGHLFSKWKRIKIELAGEGNRVVDAQERVCQRCGYTEREIL